MGFLDCCPLLIIYGIIFLIGVLLLIIAWTFDFFKNKKFADFFENLADKIKDFFT